MPTLLIWWAGNLLEALILARALRGKFFSKYPFFFTYIASVIATNSLLYALSLLRPLSYYRWYWSADLLTLLVGCGILLEILNHVLSPYPGVERFATIAGGVLFVLIFCVALIYPLVVPEALRAGTFLDLEKDLRTVQAIFLLGVVGVIQYYGVPIGRNLKGMMFGYGLYVASSLIGLALRSYLVAPSDGVWRFTAWHFIQPVAYLISLVVWTGALWSYQANPVSRQAIRLETDYEAFVSMTRSVMGTMRSYLGKAARS